jgi:hypothetical protein
MDTTATILHADLDAFYASEASLQGAARHNGQCDVTAGAAIVVMQSAEEHMRRDATDALNWARERRVFVQRSVRSQIVIIAGIGLQNPA